MDTFLKGVLGTLEHVPEKSQNAVDRVLETSSGYGKNRALWHSANESACLFR